MDEAAVSTSSVRFSFTFYIIYIYVINSMKFNTVFYTVFKACTQCIDSKTNFLCYSLTSLSISYLKFHMLNIS